VTRHTGRLGYLIYHRLSTTGEVLCDYVTFQTLAHLHLLRNKGSKEGSTDDKVEHDTTDDDQSSAPRVRVYEELCQWSEYERTDTRASHGKTCIIPRRLVIYSVELH